MWIEPIFDRTENDVIFARQQIEKWIKENTSETYDLKGCLNLSDLNRIEGNIQHIADELINLCYAIDIESKTWTRNGLITLNDVERILSNVKTIINILGLKILNQNTKKSGLLKSGGNSILPIKNNNGLYVPFGMSRFEDINTIESILLRLKETLEYIVLGFQKSNMFKSGSRRLLPIRR